MKRPWQEEIIKRIPKNDLAKKYEDTRQKQIFGFHHLSGPSLQMRYGT